jgi:plasmid stabilization system protein ParE
VKRLPVRWAPAAAGDFEEIVDYIAADRQDAAVRMAHRIGKTVEGLRANPLRGPSVPELAELGVTGYRQVVVGPYRVIYRVSEFAVFVVAVVDSRRDLKQALFGRLLR